MWMARLCWRRGHMQQWPCVKRHLAFSSASAVEWSMNSNCRTGAQPLSFVDESILHAYSNNTCMHTCVACMFCNLLYLPSDRPALPPLTYSSATAPSRKRLREPSPGPPQGGRGGASGAAALVGVALCCPSAPAPSSAEAHSLRGWRDL